MMDLFWKLDLSGNFSTKFCIDSKCENSTILFDGPTDVIWSNRYPKKIKFFLWDFAHKGVPIHDKLQRPLALPSVAMSPNWCSLCHRDMETQSHIFIFCPFSKSFWNHILSCLYLVPRDITHFLSLVIEDDPFKDRKGLLSKQLGRAFLWSVCLNGIIASSTKMLNTLTIFLLWAYFDYLLV